jgi:glycosyltransferase involved in cell wall biosynthesis
MNALTGGCHFAGSCTHWLQACGRCPLLDSNDPDDVSSKQFGEKLKALDGSAIKFLATSKKMYEMARRSPFGALLDPQLIPVSIDLANFRKRDKSFCRNALGLPIDGNYVLFSALDFTRDPRKGWSFIKDLVDAAGKARSWQLLLVGDDRAELADLTGSVSFGRLSDSEAMALIYSAADVTIMPSEEESFGKVAAESLAAGTPVVLTSAAGMAEFIEDGKTGYIFDFGDKTSALEGIARFLAFDLKAAEDVSNECALTASRIFGPTVAQDHIELYSRLIDAHASIQSTRQVDPINQRK